MENNEKSKSDIAKSILAKFQQVSKEKEEAANNKLLDTREKYFEQSKRKQPESETMHNGISEEEVGIISFISDHCGFNGILKHRFTDFQVHEIDCDGKLVELTSVAVPEQVEKAVEIDKSILPPDIWTKIEESLQSDDKEHTTEIDVTSKDKAERTLIHKALKTVFGPKVVSNTVIKENSTIIQVKKSSNRDRVCWPKSLPEFLHFTVTKKNMDTTHFICLLSKKLRTKPNYFTYAGTKDRRAITSQRMCVKRKRAEDVAKVVIWGTKMGNFEYKSKPLRLGDLSGNKFTITIRNITVESDVIEKAMDNLNKRGFINYFGLQRFGSSTIVPTYAVGKAILMKNWKLAVELVLKPRGDEKCQPWIKQAREAWWESRDSSKGLKILSRNQNSLEFRVLKFLKQNPNDYHGALLFIPRNTLLLYLHSYQSLVWNKIVTKRIQKYKLEPQVGDLVIVDSSEITYEEPAETNEKDEGPNSDDEADKEEIEAPVEEVKKVIKVQALTKENVASTSVYDIVYPLPGFDVEYPKNEIYEWYREILSEDGIHEEDLKSNEKLFSLYGTYRKAFGKVSSLDWKIFNHNDIDEDLVLSDLEKLDNKEVEKKEKLNSGGEYKSLMMDITLPPSTYATMVLREVMKSNTSVSFHASLTKSAHGSAAKKLKASPEEKEQINGKAL